MTMERININSDEINGKVLLEEELSVKEIENVDKFLTQNSIIKEMACQKSLLAYYEDVQFQNELISTLNSNIQVVLQRSKAIKAKETYFKENKIFVKNVKLNPIITTLSDIKTGIKNENLSLLHQSRNIKNSNHQTSNKRRSTSGTEYN
jgi:uncharacterized protein YoxC